MIQNHISAKIHRKQLVRALESARMRLSVAIASETKSTPRDRWRYYLDTTDQISRSIRKLRHADFESLPDFQEWIRTLDALDCLPISSRTLRLCQILRDIMTAVE